jgi:hypothetical protein
MAAAMAAAVAAAAGSRGAVRTEQGMVRKRRVRVQVMRGSRGVGLANRLEERDPSSLSLHTTSE